MIKKRNTVRKNGTENQSVNTGNRDSWYILILSMKRHLALQTLPAGQHRLLSSSKGKFLWCNFPNIFYFSLNVSHLYGIVFNQRTQMQPVNQIKTSTKAPSGLRYSTFRKQYLWSTNSCEGPGSRKYKQPYSRQDLVRRGWRCASSSPPQRSLPETR